MPSKDNVSTEVCIPTEWVEKGGEGVVAWRLYLNSKRTDTPTNTQTHSGGVGVSVGACLNAWQLSAHRISVLDHHTKTHTHTRTGKQMQRYKENKRGRDGEWREKHPGNVCWLPGVLRPLAVRTQSDNFGHSQRNSAATSHKYDIYDMAVCVCVLAC